MDSEFEPVGGIADTAGDTETDQGFRSAEKVAETYKWIDRLGLAEKMAKNKHENKRYTVTEDQLMEYKSRPLGQILGCGLLALVFLSARFWLFPLNEYLGNPFGRGIGGLTLLLMFAGAFCAFAAWPKYKYKGMSEEETEKLDKSREDFRRKFRR